MISVTNEGEPPPIRKTGEIPMNTRMTPTELADHLQVTPKEVRKFLRSITPDRAGKGGRWALDIQDLDMLTDRFRAWKSGKVTLLTLTDED